MNWDDPAARLALIERVGPDEYARQMREYQDGSILKRIGKYSLRPVNSGRFGRIIMIDGSGSNNSAAIGFRTVAECERWIETHGDKSPMISEAFILNYGGSPVWKAIVDGVVIPAEFKSKGGALAAIPVERARRLKKSQKKT